MSRKKQRNESTHPDVPAVLRPNAAGVDIGAREIFVAVPTDRDSQPVRSYATFTEDLHRLADWLHSCGIQTVAMESTGVYWIPLFQILEGRGLEVCLVNARYYQNVPGRRTDVSDCQWLQYLHSVGLLRASFRPDQQVCTLRSLLRHRVSLIETASEQVLRMQKALDQMNLQIHHVISDVTRADGLGDPRRNTCWRTRSGGAGAIEGSKNQSIRRDDRQISGWGLSAGAHVYVTPVAGSLPLLPKIDR